MCQAYHKQYGSRFVSVMPTNLYGQNDNYDLEKSHVLPALIRKIHLAKLLNESKFDEVLKDTKFDTIEESKIHLSKFVWNDFDGAFFYLFKYAQMIIRRQAVGSQSNSTVIGSEKIDIRQAVFDIQVCIWTQTPV